MNYGAVEKQLLRLLNGQGNHAKVLALTGLWGSGKTHLWQTARIAPAAGKEIRSALYASLFGVSSIDEVRLRLMQSAIKLGEAPKEDALKGGASALIKFVESVVPGGKAVSALQHAISPMVMAGKLLVLDDIERKSVSLNTEAVLGFVDEMTQRYNCRVLLILNDESLMASSDVWSQMREKVVDHELRLSPSPEEAFAMAMENCGSPPPHWSESAKAAVAECGIVNIRILKKIRYVLSDVLMGLTEVPQPVLDRVTSASTLLTSVYYRGIKDVPDIATIAKEHDGSFAWDQFFRDPRTKIGLPSDETEGWKKLFRRLGVHRLGNFESALIDYLNSGWSAPPHLRLALENLIAKAEEDSTADQCHRFFMAEHWDHQLSNDDLLNLARPIVRNSHHLAGAVVSSLVDTLNSIRGGEALAETALAKWVENASAVGTQLDPFGDPFGRKLHPTVELTLRRIQDTAFDEVDVLAACRTIRQRQAWGEAEMRALNSAAVEQYKTLICEKSGSDLRVLFGTLLQAATVEDSGLRPAADKFLEACRSLHSESENSRLIRLIDEQFGVYGQQLDPAPPDGQ